MVKGSRATISFPTNVRHPLIIRNYLRTLVNHGFNHYDEKFQRDFLIALAKDGYYTGKIEELTNKSKEFQGRVRYGYLKWFGFAWHDDDYNIYITSSGKKFLEDNPHEIWLKQLLKWQLPNPHHSPPRYGDFAILPFVAMLDILRSLKYITTRETGIFYLPLRQMKETKKCIREIEQYREGKKDFKDINKLRDFVKKHWKTKELYVEKPEDFKLLLIEYPRSLFTYYQYSELATVSGKTLVIREDKLQDIDRILSTVPRDIRDYKTTKEWYDFFGNYQLPTLPYENLDDLKRRLSKFEEENRKLKETVTSLHVPPITELEKTIQHYKEILNKDVLDPPTSLEWNTKRAFDQMGGFKQVIWNGQEDSSGNPSIHAGPGEPDIIIYATSYVLVVEVTLSTGATQWRTETYSVPEHVDVVANKLTNYQTVGLFLAPAIHDQTYKVFWDRCKEGRPGIVPLNIEAFLGLLRYAVEVNGITPSEFLSLLRRLINEAEGVSSSKFWKERCPSSIETWKMSVNQKRQVYQRMFKIYEFFLEQHKKYGQDVEFPFDQLWMHLKSQQLFSDRSHLKTTLEIMASLNLIQKNGNYIRAPIDDFELSLKRFVNILKSES